MAAKPNPNAPLGEGGRFAYVVEKLKARGMSEKRAKAVAASIGRKKYGKAKMAQLAAKGRRDAAKGK